jgi:lipopolysaccharide export system permease protein
MRGIRIFEHDAGGVLLRRIQAATGRAERVGSQAVWRLQDVQLTEWPLTDDDPVLDRHLDQLDWPTTLQENVVAAAISPIRSMSTLDLWRYSRHLQHQEQAAQRYELQFWRRAFYPFACVVMVALALPFAYLHARAGGISLKVFGGIMLGISFVLLNNVVGHLGLLRDWTPWIASALPSLLYLLMSLTAFGWLVRYR